MKVEAADYVLHSVPHYDSLPTGQKLLLCACCMELLTLREQVGLFEVRVADLEKR